MKCEDKFNGKTAHFGCRPWLKNVACVGCLACKGAELLRHWW